MRPLHGLGGSLGPYPGRIAAALREQLVERGQQDGDHGAGRQILPAEHPIEIGPRSGHHLNVIRETAHAINIANREALEEGDDQQRKVAGEAVHQLEYIAPGSVGKAHGDQAAGEAKALREKLL